MGFGFAKLFWPRRICPNGKGLFSPWTPAPDIVEAPHVARNLPLSHSSKVGIEYVGANGGVIVNPGAQRATVKTKMDSDVSLIMSFQVVELHKPFLAVTKLV